MSTWAFGSRKIAVGTVVMLLEVRERHVIVRDAEHPEAWRWHVSVERGHALHEVDRGPADDEDSARRAAEVSALRVAGEYVATWQTIVAELGGQRGQ